MEIIYLGHSSFKLKGKTASLVTDPYDSSFVGFKFPKTQADIVTVSHQHKDHNFTTVVEGGPFIISDPGEYEIKGISVFGFSSFHDAKAGKERGENIVYLIEIDGLKICHLGDLGNGLPANVMEEIGAMDILMIPVGGIVTLGLKEVIDFIQQVEPKIVLPMHFKTTKMSETFNNLAPVEEFLTKIGSENPEKLDKLLITKDKLPEEMKVILLERKS